MEKTSKLESAQKELSVLKTDNESLRAKNKMLEDHLQQVQEQSWSGHWELDIKTKEVTWSESMYDLLSIPMENEPNMKLFYEKLSPVDKDKLNGAIKKTFINHQDYSFEHNVIRDTNTELNARTDLKISYSDDGKPDKLIGNTSDITTIKSAQKELERLSMIASKTSNAVAVLNLDADIQWINQGFTLMVGYRFDEIANQGFQTLFYAQKKGLISKENLFTTLLSTQQIKEEVRVKSKFDDDIWALITINPILDYELNPESYIVIMSDITEQKLNEQVLQEKSDTILEQKAEVDKKNGELEVAFKALTRAKISRKSIIITFFLAIVLFVISEVVIDPQIENYFDRSQELMIAGKLFLALLLKPIEDVVRRKLYRAEMKKRRLENQEESWE